MVNRLLENTRKGAFVAASLFALIVIILSGVITSITASLASGGYFAFAALGIATGLLTILTLPAMLFMSITRKGILSSMIAIDVAWTFFLWILWLATAASAASINWVGGCGGSYIGRFNNFSDMCRETHAVAAFAFFAWLVLFAYNVAMIFFAVRQHSCGHSGIWTGYVNETDFTAPPVSHDVYAGGAQQETKGAQQPPANQYAEV